VADARDAALPAASAGAPAAVGSVTGLRRAAPSEHSLVRAAQGGSAEAMEELFRRHWPRAHRAAWLVVHDAAAAEDVAQEAFLAAVRSLDRFDRRRPFGPWLHRIVVNRAIDHARARDVRREVPAEAVADAAAAGPGSFGPSDEVVAALAALAPEQRAVIVLRHLLGFTPGEIARVLGLPRGTVNSRLRRGLDALVEPLRDEAPAGPGVAGGEPGRDGSGAGSAPGSGAGPGGVGRS
jgi:RNA polymerase sigma-70 factor (ECF subfamily)